MNDLYLKKCLQEVFTKLEKLGKNHGSAKPTYFNTELPFFADIPVPKKRALLKAGFSFSNLSNDDQKRVWTYIFMNGTHFEVLSMPLMFYAKHKAHLTKDDWRVLKNWVSRIDNWAHSDSLSDLYSALHERYPKEIFGTLKKWNSSKYPWLRRQSIVSLFYYSSQRKKYPEFKKVINQIKPLIHDKHIYVQKGVGWTLRECWNVYPKKTYEYLKSIVIDLHPAAWQAATEKLSTAQKNELKRIRAGRKVKRNSL